MDIATRTSVEVRGLTGGSHYTVSEFRRVMYEERRVKTLKDAQW